MIRFASWSRLGVGLSSVSMLCFFVLILSASSVSAQDQIRRTVGGNISGTIKSVGRFEVTITRLGKDEAISTGLIESIAYQGEAAEIKTVRSNYNNGAFENALKSLEKVPAEALAKAEIKQDVDFYRAASTANLALTGTGDAAAAKQLLDTFLKTYPESYHTMQALELLGNLHVATGAYAEAQTQFALFDQAPSVDLKMKGGIALGRVLEAQQKFAEALAAYEKIIALGGQDNSDSAQQQVLSASLGKASCLAESGKAVEAVTMIEQIISKLPPEQLDLHAQAYLSLGNCQIKSPNGAKAAELAYLHVDVLYFNNAQAHAEALAHLVELWTQQGKVERAAQAKQTLKTRYAGSPWTAKVQ